MPGTHIRRKSLRKLFVESLEGRRLLAFAPATPATSDLNDDGRVNNADLALLRTAFNARVGIDTNLTKAGLQGYHEGLDLNFDGTIINTLDYQAVYDNWGKTGIQRSPTSVVGRVFDNYGNPLKNVRVSIDGTKRFAFSDADGNFNITAIPVGSTGFQQITFDGSQAEDPTVDVGSGKFPTIPHKPIFINGGTQVRFRDMSLPELDYSGAIDLSFLEQTVNPDGSTSVTTLEDVTVDNSGVTIKVPAGSVITFPPGADPILSITRVDPARVPIPMPIGLSSTLFITYQPGGTVISNPDPNARIVTTFDNFDRYDATHDTNPSLAGVQLTPGLAGVTAGVFSQVGTTELVDSDNDNESQDPSDQLVATVPMPFEFAWYHVDIIQQPCARTIVTGQVKQFGTNAVIANAIASVPGVGPVPTDDQGRFSIFNVPAGPNGPRCTSDPFNIRASAGKDVDVPANGLQGDEVGQSNIVAAVPGGITDVGMIFIGETGGAINGAVTKLVSLEPFLIEQVDQARIDLFSTVGSDSRSVTTGPDGLYNFSNVNVGAYSLNASDANGFFNFFDQNPFDTEINPPGDLDVHNFTQVARGNVLVHVVDIDGNPVPNHFVRVEHSGQDFGSGYFSNFEGCSGFSDAEGVLNCGGDGYGGDGYGGGDLSLPLGDFFVSDDQFNQGEFQPLAGVGGGGSSVEGRINEEGETVDVTLVVTPRFPEGDIASVTFQTIDIQQLETTVLDTNIFFSSPSSNFNLIIEFDINPETGGSSQIDQFYANAQSLEINELRTGLANEVDFRVQCFINSESSGCSLHKWNGESLDFDQNLDFIIPDLQNFSFQIPLSELGVSGEDQIRAAVASQTFLFLGQFSDLIDTVPNGGNIAYIVGNTSTEVDSLGDLFSVSQPTATRQTQRLLQSPARATEETQLAPPVTLSVDTTIATRSDVNSDGLITPVDVLLLIDGLQRPTAISARGLVQDINNDGVLSPLDVLLVIDQLSRQRQGSIKVEGETSNAFSGDPELNDLALIDTISEFDLSGLKKRRR